MAVGKNITWKKRKEEAISSLKAVGKNIKRGRGEGNGNKSRFTKIGVGKNIKTVH